MDLGNGVNLIHQGLQSNEIFIFHRLRKVRPGDEAKRPHGTVLGDGLRGRLDDTVGYGSVGS